MPAKIKYPIVIGMKECGDCGEWKPVSEYKKARNHLSSACKPCRKIYFAEYRSRPENKVQASEYHKEYIQNPINRERKNAYTREYRKGVRPKQVRNSSRRLWTEREKQKAVDYKGGKCIVCGYNTYLGAMDFHHRNPSEKDGYGTGALKAHWSFERNKPEIDKCVLVCVRCHREIHGGIIIL